MGLDNVNWDAYERNKAPEEPPKPRHFDIKRPFRFAFLCFLKVCWRSTTLHKTRWDGSQEPGIRIASAEDHGSETAAIFTINFAVALANWALLGIWFGSGLVGLLLAATWLIGTYMAMIFVATAFNLYEKEARAYWSERLM